jgi:toxin ParE1/3/4
MATFRYTKRAEQELSNILAYTEERWGKTQSQRYLDQLAATLTLLAENKQMGRTYSKSHPAWRRFEQGSHIIVYSPVADGIRVQRIIHKSQLFERAIR